MMLHHKQSWISNLNFLKKFTGTLSVTKTSCYNRLPNFEEFLKLKIFNFQKKLIPTTALPFCCFLFEFFLLSSIPNTPPVYFSQM